MSELEARLEAAKALAKAAIREKAEDAHVYADDPVQERVQRAVAGLDATVSAYDLLVALGEWAPDE